MKFNFEFSNLCGSVYRQGNVVFTADGNTLLSPVGNRISVFDLVGHKCSTLPIENLKNISRLALSPNNSTLISVDEDGRCILINFFKRVVLCQFHFKKPVLDIQFSPDSKYIAVTHGSHLQVWLAPPLITEYRPFALYRTYTGHYDDIVSIQWSDDSQCIFTGSADMTVRMFSLHSMGSSWLPQTMSGHRAPLIGCFLGRGDQMYGNTEPTPKFDQPGAPVAPDSVNVKDIADFSADDVLLFTISKDGALYIWKFHPDGLPDSDSDDDNDNDDEEEDDEDDEAEDADSGSSGDEKEEEKKGQAVTSAGGKRSGKVADRPNQSGWNKQKKRVRRRDMPFLCKGKFAIYQKHYFKQDNAKVLCASVHRPRGLKALQTAMASSTVTGAVHSASQLQLLVVGFSNGVFALYELPQFSKIHTLSISTKRINTLAINPTGDWLAFGSSKLGQLLVWEWQSETYVLKQQGHFFDINACSYSPDGQLVATGGDDGKVKLWNTTTGFCFVTFSEHTGPVTAVELSPVGNVVVSAGMDGTVRAYDLVRYRNFRTMTAPTVCQFTCLAVDPSGEVICAGAFEPFEIYVWSLQTGRLLDVLTGHTGPLSGLAFSPHEPILASSSWDKTVKIWDIFARKVDTETFEHGTDVLAVTFRPDGKELCSSALDGQLYLWDVHEGKLKSTIEGRKDIQGGRLENDPRAAKNSTHGMAFNSMCYSADGTCILAGGNSKYVCIYELSQRILLRKFQISHNQSLDGMLEFLNSKNMTTMGAMTEIDDEASDSDVENRIDTSLPGAKRSDFSSRKVKLAIRTKCVRFSPTGMQWAAASTDGLLLYSLDQTESFDPFDLDLDVTPANILKTLASKHYSKALIASLRLNEDNLIARVIEHTPPADVPLVVRSLPTAHLQRVLRHLASRLEQSPHLEFLLMWTQCVLTSHGPYIKTHAAGISTTLRALQKIFKRHYGQLSSICDSNKYTLQYVSTARASESSIPQPEDEESMTDLGIDESAPQMGLFQEITGEAFDAPADEALANAAAAALMGGEDDWEDPPVAPAAAATAADESGTTPGKKRKRKRAKKDGQTAAAEEKEAVAMDTDGVEQSPDKAGKKSKKKKKHTKDQQQPEQEQEQEQAQEQAEQSGKTTRTRKRSKGKTRVKA